MFDAERWAAVPFHFWTFVFFGFGAIVGSFLNVCIYRMPRNLSVVSPPSHCPNCNYSIPWYLNIPLVTWLYLHAKCRNCGANIPARYFLVELLTAVLFAGAWLIAGPLSPWVALSYCVLLAGLVVATFIDFEHFIIPDEITLGGMAAGFIFSFAWPILHIAWPNSFRHGTSSGAAKESIIGMLVGGGTIYGILRLGKLLFGKYRIDLPEKTIVQFTETSIKLPDEEIPYEELFYRKSDFIEAQAERIQLPDRCYFEAKVRLSPKSLRVGDDEFNPEDVPGFSFVTKRLTMPREAMGFGDVKFMAAIGAFLGWPAVIFSLMASSMIGSLVGVTLIILKKRDRGARLPYGPYIALGAILWIFGGEHWVVRWFATF